MSSSAPERSPMMSPWKRWKRFWRKLETAGPVWRAKRLVRQAIGTELRYFPQARLPTVHYGEWRLWPGGLSSSSIVYSFGVGDEADFDVALIERWGLSVHAFDPTPTSIEWVRTREFPDGFNFHPVGIADFDGRAEFSAPVTEGSACYTLLERESAIGDPVAAEVRRLATIAAELGHDHIDLLKMDIEGAEYAVIPDVIRSGIPVRQLLVEFHHRFRNVGNEPTRQAVELLLANGFRILHISPSGREYAFVHQPSTAPAT